MAVNNEVLAIILGGGQGTRLFPLTQHRSKPAVPIGGKYRLIDIPISNCLHADMRRIFVLTQFNSASLNRHIAQTYRMDLFSQGFVEILAAEQTPDNPNWYQGTADAVRQAARHFVRYDADYYLILAGDHLYRMDYGELVDAHIDRRADITIAAQPVAIDDASAMGIFRFDRSGQIVAFEEKPTRERLDEIGQSIPPRRHCSAATRRRSRSSRRWASTCSRATCCSRRSSRKAPPTSAARSFRRRSSATACTRTCFAATGRTSAPSRSFYDANIMLTRAGAPFKFYDPRRPIYTHPRFLPGARLDDCTAARTRSSPKAATSIAARSRNRSSASAPTSRPAPTIRRSVLLGADFYEADDEAPARAGSPRLGIGRDVVLDRVIVDKNARIGDGARLVNEAGVQHADGDGYYIRDGVIVVPKDGVVKPGTRV